MAVGCVAAVGRSEVALVIDGPVELVVDLCRKPDSLVVFVSAEELAVSLDFWLSSALIVFVVSEISEEDVEASELLTLADVVEGALECLLIAPFALFRFGS